MIYASTKLNETSDAKVFVDASGRRRRLLMTSGVVAAVGAVLYIGVVAASLVRAPEAELTTKATVSATEAARTSASAAATKTAKATTAAATQAASAAPSAPVPPNGQQPGLPAGPPDMPAGPR